MDCGWFLVCIFFMTWDLAPAEYCDRDLPADRLLGSGRDLHRELPTGRL
jgi:hypothetical protein